MSTEPLSIERLFTPNYWTINTLRTSKVAAIVLHGTSGNLAGSLDWLRNPKSGVSANFVIAKSGQVYQLVDPAGGRAWANGIVDLYDQSVKWLDQAVKNKINPNWITISIEHEATREDMLFHRPMTDQQFNSSIELTASLLKQFGLKAGHETIIAHCQIAGQSKATCPGVIFVPAYTEVLIKRHPDLG